MPLSPNERSLRARIGAHAQHAKHDARETTSKARQAFASRFEQQVDPDNTLDPAERAKRADHALKAHMTGLALRSAQARRKAG